MLCRFDLRRVGLVAKGVAGDYAVSMWGMGTLLRRVRGICRSKSLSFVLFGNKVPYNCRIPFIFTASWRPEIPNPFAMSQSALQVNMVARGPAIYNDCLGSRANNRLSTSCLLLLVPQPCCEPILDNYDRRFVFPSYRIVRH